MVVHYLYVGTHSVATRIECVTRDLQVSGSPPVWVSSVRTYTSGATDLSKAWWCAKL